ncbi:MAG: hypothetical protein IPH74_11195 [Bacteroidetes bacterium]|nr:hypothetical protein [Bacteroidota bacterium]
MQISTIINLVISMLNISGSNRFIVINNILFQQHKIELSHPNFLVKAYTTIENAGQRSIMVLQPLTFPRQALQIMQATG